MSNVVQLAGQVVAEEERQLSYGTVSGQVKDVLVQTGQEVIEGQPLVRLDTSALERALREAEADRTVAETALAAAQQTSGAAEIADAKARLAQAQYTLANAKQALDKAEAAGLAPLQAAIQDAEAALQSARDDLRMKEIRMNRSTIRQLEYQKAFLQRTIRDSQPGTTEHADAQEGLIDVERQLTQAQSERDKALAAGREAVETKIAEIEEAKERLARVQAGDEDPLAALRLDYEQAVAVEEQARKRLEDLRQGVDSEAVQGAKTALEAATAKVEDVEASIEATTLVAPFEGVIFGAFVSRNSVIQASDKIIYLVNAKNLNIVAQATEADISKLQVGQAIRASFDARPNAFYDAEIIELPIRGQEGGGMSSYRIVAALTNPDHDVRPGLMANLRVITGEKEDVLMVPTAAIQYRSPWDIYVSVVDAEGQKRERKIEIGMNDGIMVEVLSGLSEGETVVLPLVPPMGPGRNMPGEVIIVE